MISRLLLPHVFRASPPHPCSYPLQQAPQGVAKLRLDALLRGWPRPAAAVGGGRAGNAGANAGAAAVDVPGAADAHAAAEGLRLQLSPPPPPPPPTQAQQGHAASASGSGPVAEPLRRFVDTAGPSLSSSTNTSTTRFPGAAAVNTTAGRTAEGTGLDGCVQRMPLRLLPLWAFPVTAPGQVLRRGCADRLVVAQGGQPGPLSLGVLMHLYGKNPVSQGYARFRGLRALSSFLPRRHRTWSGGEAVYVNK